MGTTADKLTYLNNTKLAIKNELNKLGAEIEDSDTFRSYVNKLKAIYDDYPTVSDTDSSISLNNTKKAPLKSVALNSTELTQDGTPSPSSPVDVNVIKGENNVVVQNKNLSVKDTTTNPDENYMSGGQQGSNAIEYSQEEEGFYTSTFRIRQYNGLEAGTKYTISFLGKLRSEGTQSYPAVVYFYNTKTQASSASQGSVVSKNVLTNEYVRYSRTYTLTSGYDAIRILFYGCLYFKDIQLEIGSTATDFIEHQEQNYPISLASKNLFNPNTITLNKYISGMDGILYDSASSNASDFISINGGQNYTFSFDYDTLASSNERAICFYKEDKTYITYTTYGFTEKHTTITPPSNAKYVRFTLDKNMTDIQLEIGSTPSAYEPYYNIEYCKIGDYADQISNQFESKNLFDYTRIANAPIWPDWESSGGRQLEFIVKPNTQYTLSSNVPQGSSTLLYFNGSVTATNGVWVNNPKTMTSDNNGILYVYFFNNRDYYNDIKNGTYYIQLEEGDTASEYMAYGITKGEWYLKKNIGKIDSYNGQTITTPYISTTGGLDTGATIYYGLTTPTYIQISQTDYPTLKGQLEDIYNNAKSYNGQTNITQTNDDLPFNISVSALLKGDI